MTDTVPNVERLDDLLSEPSPAAIDAMARLPGDLLVLGAGGKIGLSLARMAKRASEIAGVPRRVVGVSRFSAPGEQARWHAHGIPTIPCDLMDDEAVARLPDAPNIAYLAGMKFGSLREPSRTWAVNAWLPGVVCRRFPDSRIVAFSTGNVYGLTRVDGGGSLETDAPVPVGEYAMSCLGRERVFEHFSLARGTPIVLVRLFYACELRYGVLVDLATKVAAGEPIDLAMGHANVCWQGDCNDQTLRLFARAASPATVINMTGPEVLSIRTTATELGRLMGREPVFVGTESETACLGNTAKARALFGAPRVDAARLVRWTADWVARGGATLGKPTHFEVRDGRY